MTTNYRHFSGYIIFSVTGPIVISTRLGSFVPEDGSRDDFRNLVLHLKKLDEGKCP
jgi:hypothetical protein